MSVRLSGLGFYILLLVQTTNAQSLKSRLDQYISNELNNLSIPDLEVLVVNRDTVKYSKSIGREAGINSTYYIGSVSKSLTAFAILKLIEDKKISFESKVIEIIPEIRFSSDKEEVTIWHLLTHTSGIDKKTGFKNLPTLKDIENSTYVIENDPIKPLRHVYSNFNYSLLGLIIEKVTQTSFDEFMNGTVFEMLDMGNSVIGKRDEINSILISQYQYFGPYLFKSSQMDYSTTSIPAGFICSSANDLANYLRMNLSFGKFDQNQIIDSTLLQKMHTTWDNSEFGYTMGWKQGKYNGMKFYQHLGSTATSYSGIFFVPEKQLGFVLLTNSNSLSFSEQFAEGILNILTEGDTIETSLFEYYLRLIILIGIIISALVFCYKSFLILKRESCQNYRKEIINLLIQTIILVFVIFGFPFVAQITFIGFFKMQPDIGFFILSLLLFPIFLTSFRIIRISFT